MHPDNVLIRCPNGHELQAARSDLGKVLSCPVCNTTFATAAPSPAAAAPGGGIPPAPIDYAGYGAYASSYGAYAQSRTVLRPAYTGALMGLWITSEVLGAIAGIISWTGEYDPQRPNPFMIGVGCLMTPVFIAAVVLQLMWIYRIHRDALAARNYGEFSPGLALGLSFIPAFNYVWTGLTMKRLAGFSADGDRSIDPRATEAVRANTICFYFGIVKAAFYVASMLVSGVVGVRAAMQGMTADPRTFLAPGIHVFSVLVMAVNLTSVIVYAWAAKKLHASLYDHLGAPA